MPHGFSLHAIGIAIAQCLTFYTLMHISVPERVERPMTTAVSRDRVLFEGVRSSPVARADLAMSTRPLGNCFGRTGVPGAVGEFCMFLTCLSYLFECCSSALF